jgi:hypothetical protein
MIVPFSALTLAAHLTVAVVDNFPKFDVMQSCRGAEAAASAATAKVTMERCLAVEQSAHDRLVKEWQNFGPVDRAKCISGIAFYAPTYTEVLTCLEFARELRNLK